MARLIIFGVAAVLMLCLFESALSGCCFVCREPCVYQTCGCFETPAGVVSCYECPAYTSSTTACSTCASCFKDAASPCKECPAKPSPVCSCLKTLDSTCGCSGCGSSKCGGSKCGGSKCGGSACSSSKCGCSDCDVSTCGSSKCGCSDCGCGCKRLKIYFPEVEYPNTIIEMTPFYYANCWTF